MQKLAETDQKKIDFTNDPFARIRNKEQAMQLIEETIEGYFLRSPDLVNSSGLGLERCKDLAITALDRMRARQLRFEDFSENNFITSYRLYEDRHAAEIEKP